MTLLRPAPERHRPTLPRQILRDDLPVIKRQSLRANDLITLVPLAGDHYTVPFLCKRECEFDCPASIRLDGKCMGAAKPGYNFPNDPLWILRARVVARDNDHVRDRLRRLRHHGPLRSIPVATGAKDAKNAS